MESQYFNGKNFVILSMIILVACIITRVVLVGGISIEKFDKTSTDKHLPYVDPKTGTLIDGPGYEHKEIDNSHLNQQTKIQPNHYFLDDGADGEMSIQHNLCSRSCCSEQWPTPFKQKYDKYVCNNKNQYVSSNIFCNNTFQDSGCLCLTKKQQSFIYNRGGNGREWF